MNITTKLLAAGLAAGFLAVGFVAANGAATAADMSVIDKRKDLMKNVVGKNFGVVKNFIEKGQGSAADVKKAADALVAAAPKIAPLFVKGTGRPDVDPKKTRAVAKIWEDWASFETNIKALQTEAAKLSKIADGGDKEAIKKQFGETGKNGCGACHKPFRGDEVK